VVTPSVTPSDPLSAPSTLQTWSQIFKMKEPVVWAMHNLHGHPLVAYCSNSGEVRVGFRVQGLGLCLLLHLRGLNSGEVRLGFRGLGFRVLLTAPTRGGASRVQGFRV
jgi:hypothetical protein